MVSFASPWLARWFAAAMVLIAAPCIAQSDDIDPFNWAYAAALGSGVYRLSDGTQTQSYRGNFSIALRRSDAEQSGVRLLLPMAFGVENLDDDIRPLERGADDIEHVGFLPGVELEHNLGQRWTLRSRAQLGYAQELEGAEESAQLAAVGVRGRIQFDEAPGKPALISGILWTGFDSSDGSRGALMRLTLGAELDIRAARWRVRDNAMSWRPHLLMDWYDRPPPALAYSDDDDGEIEPYEEWQFGVAAAREGGFKILFFKFEAVGVAYRFSEHGEGLRFYLNSVF